MPSRDYAKGFYQNAPSRFAPPTPEAAGMGTHTPRCKLCGQTIVYVVMEGTGKRMPCDPTQRYGDGRRHLVVRVEDLFGNIVGKLIARAGEEVLGFEPHWGTCPPLLKKRELEKAKARHEDERAAGRAWLDEMLGGEG